MAYLLFFVIPVFILPCLGLVASGWGAWIIYDGLLDRRPVRAGVGAIVLVVGLGLLLLAANYLVHPFSPTD